MITRHPSGTSLLSYATGTMPDALGVVMATHLGYCATCRRTLATMEAMGGVLLDALPPVPLASFATDQDALDRLLDRPEPPAAAVPTILHADLPSPLNRVPMGRWFPIGIGVQWRPMRLGGSAWGGLILAQPRRTLPRHGHAGLELTCVLSGAFADAGRSHGVGDMAEPEDDHDRPPVVISAEPCLCVIATEGIHLRGLLGFAQRLIGL